MSRVTDIHISHGIVPDSVEFGFLIQLNGYHHPIGHAFGADVVMRNIADISQGTVRIGARREINGLARTVAVKKLLKSVVDLGGDLRFAMPALFEEITVMAG